MGDFSYKSDYEMSECVIVLPDAALSQIIRKSLGENEEKLESRVELFRNWLESADCLPKNIDATYIKNLIRASKFNILNARKKFELLMYTKATWSHIFDYTKLMEDDVFKFPMHRRGIASRCLTKDGYRLLSLKFNSADAQYVCVDRLISYLYLLVEHLLWKDFCSGAIIINDYEDFYTEFLANINMKTFKICLGVFLKAMPFRIKNIHFCNLTVASKLLVNIILTLMSENMKQRVVYHETTHTLKQYIDIEDLPKDYGGEAECLEDVGEVYKRYLFENKQLVRDIANQKLVGALPKERRKYLGDFERFSADGSFRKLDID